MPRYSQAALCAGDHDGAESTFAELGLQICEGAARGNGSGSVSNGDESGSTVDAAMALVDMMRSQSRATILLWPCSLGKDSSAFPS